MAFVDTDPRINLAYGVAGLSIALDSLSAIKYARVTARRNAEGLTEGFDIEGEFPCYGNNDDRVDHLGVDLVYYFSEELKKLPVYKNARPTLSLLTITSNVMYGKKTGATPDGRLKGVAFAPGANPILDKLSVLADAAKYDAACTSSGAKRGFQSGKIGCTSSGVMGCCHSFSADGRCITLLKVLLSNDCMYDCKYCVNRRTNETRRATFTPEELADLTIQFYRRNYIEGLFLSSGVLRSPDYTTELMIRALSILRREYRFNGYIHAKAIPGASPEL